MKTRTISQTATFKAAPHEVYDLIMDARKHSAITGAKATINKDIGGEFELFDGYCCGYNIELVPGSKIVQAWHFDEDGWPDDHYSICTFKFDKTDTGTEITFTQTGVPEHVAKSLEGGWKQYYWDAIEEYLQADK